MIIIHGIISGLVATILFDILQISLNYAYGVNKTQWDLVGRYFLGFRNKNYIRSDLKNDKSENYELLIGYLIHYLIGIVFGIIYVLINFIFYNEPSILIALIFGFTTILGAWCIMMPFAYNLGFFGSKSDDQYQIMTQGLIAHFIFGTGLFIGYSII